MPRFSERNGYVAAKAIQFERMDAALRTSLWNFIEVVFFESEAYQFHKDPVLKNQAMILYDRFHKKAVRTLPFEIDEFVAGESVWFSTKAQWYEVYDYCEFCLSTLGDPDANRVQERQTAFNGVLEREKSGYRVIDGIITPIIEKEQIRSIQAALDSPYKYRAAAEHVKTALVLYADRKTPDYRNSIKESISAIEAVAKIISGKDKATLADALKIIDANKPMHEAFKQALQKLYGYTSDAKGVRHALLDETAIDEVDARFMIVACSAFVTYLISRA